MDSFDTNDIENREKRKLTRQIHRTLAHSYSLFFAIFIVGILAHIFHPVRAFASALAAPLGLALLALATILIFWAQYTSSRLKQESPSVEHFCQGPYCISRSPTHWGLLFLMLGFGTIVNSAVILVASLAAFVATRAIFIRKEEEALAKKYGAPYLEYKRKVKL